MPKRRHRSPITTPDYLKDAFPDSEKLFHDAFTQPDPVPELLNLLKQHPTYLAVIELLVQYSNVAEEHPDRAEELVSALVAFRDSPEAPSIQEGFSLDDIFNEKLSELHSQGFGYETKTFGPTNEFLANSLLSSLSSKYKLIYSPEAFFIQQGLEGPERWPAPEVMVTGACIQLLTDGSDIVPGAGAALPSESEIATKLKAQKDAGTVKDENALRLLELAISHAEMGFKRENDIDNVWQLLFPPQA